MTHHPCRLCLRIPVKNLGACRFERVGSRVHRFNLNDPRRNSACGKARRP